MTLCPGVAGLNPVPIIGGKRKKKCCLCGKPVYECHSKYCRRCCLFAARVRVRMFPREVVEYLYDYVRKYRLVCYYTGVALDLYNIRSPWYLSFDHWLPGDNRKVVLTCVLINCMKSDLTEDEFWYYVEQLDRFRKTGRPIRKRKLEFWTRLHPPEFLCQYTKIMCQYTKIKGKKCFVCGKPVWNNRSSFCLKCAEFRRRTYGRVPALAAKKVLDYLHRKGYVCYYTGMPLEMDDPKGPWYGVLDHWIPKDNRKMVLTSALLNDMKEDLAEDEFWNIIAQLAAFKRTGRKIKKIKLRYWDRKGWGR